MKNGIPLISKGSGFPIRVEVKSYRPKSRFDLLEFAHTGQ
jgi:hypothetical protein